MLVLREEDINVGHYYSHGIESTIYEIQNGLWRRKDELFKKFNSNTTREILERKKNVLLFLEKLDELKEFFPEIKYLVENDLGVLVGYVMQKIYGVRISGEKKDINLNSKMKALEAFRNIIDLFRKYGLLFIDIRIPNLILEDRVRPMVLDVDGILLMDNPVYDMVPTSLYRYLECNGKMDLNAQIYMFNLLSLEVLKDYLGTMFAYDKDGQEIIDILKGSKKEVPVNSVVDHEYLYQHIKRKQI